MNKELALRTFGYLIGHYKTHDETIINSQEIEAINFILKDNENLEQQVKNQKEVIDNANKLINHYLKNIDESGSYVETNTGWKLIPEILKELEDILKEVLE